jgi:hypothetical protein
MFGTKIERNYFYVSPKVVAGCKGTLRVDEAMQCGGKQLNRSKKVHLSLS